MGQQAEPTGMEDLMLSALALELHSRRHRSGFPEFVQCVPSALRLFCVGSAPFALDVDCGDPILHARSLFALYVAFVRCM